MGILVFVYFQEKGKINGFKNKPLKLLLNDNYKKVQKNKQNNKTQNKIINFWTQIEILKSHTRKELHLLG